VIINDSSVINSNDKEIFGKIGGTSSFIAGFLKHIVKKNLNAFLIGNFQNFTNTSLHCKIINTGSNIRFLGLLSLHFLINIFDRSRFLFYCHRPDHLAVALLAKGKHVVHLHGQPHTTINNGRNWFKKFIYNRLEKFAINKADLIIATDQVTVNLYTSLYPGIQSRISIIPTGVNLQAYSPNSNSLPFPGFLPKAKNIVFIGRLAYPKQVSTIINAFSAAFSNNDAVHLWIAGSGPDEQILKALAAQSYCASNIHFTGHLSRESVISLIGAADAGILISHNEGSPIVIKEFLASGKPVIVNDVGDITDYVKDGVNGYIVDPKRPVSIENAMQVIIDKSQDMSSACRESMLPYDEEKIYEKVLQLLLQLQNSR